MALKECKKMATPARGTLTSCVDLDRTSRISPAETEAMIKQEEAGRELSKKAAIAFERRYKDKLAAERAAEQGQQPITGKVAPDIAARVDGLESKMDKILELLEGRK